MPTKPARESPMTLSVLRSEFSFRDHMEPLTSSGQATIWVGRLTYSLIEWRALCCA